MLIGPARNVHPGVIGRQLFREHCLPDINALADLAHEHGKLSGSHFDAPIGYLKDEIAASRLDVVEAFTPGPVSGLCVGEALAAWPGKSLWANFPPEAHIRPREGIRDAAVEILRQTTPGSRFLLGVTEDVPEDAWRTSFPIIAQAVLEQAGPDQVRT